MILRKINFETNGRRDSRTNRNLDDTRFKIGKNLSEFIIPIFLYFPWTTKIINPLLSTDLSLPL